MAREASGAKREATGEKGESGRRPTTVKSRGFRDLGIWKKGMEIAEEVYRITENLPPGERYGLVAQMRRAAVALPSNVAEGFRRASDPDFKRFLRIALGSAAELETQLELRRRLFECRDGELERLEDMLDHFQAMTVAFIRAMGGDG